MFFNSNVYNRNNPLIIFFSFEIYIPFVLVVYMKWKIMSCMKNSQEEITQLFTRDDGRKLSHLLQYIVLTN